MLDSLNKDEIDHIGSSSLVSRCPIATLSWPTLRIPQASHCITHQLIAWHLHGTRDYTALGTNVRRWRLALIDSFTDEMRKKVV